MHLRNYQQAAVSSVYHYLRTSQGNPVVVIPTGGGKTPVIAAICRDAVIQWNSRVIMLAHVKELLEQNVAHLISLDRSLAPMIGIYSAGLGSKDAARPITVAGIQSIYKAEIDPYDLVIIDEVHRTPPEGEGMYRTFLEKAKKINPNIRAIGFTATPYRTTSGMICSPENIFTDVCYEIGIRQMVNEGWLTKLVSYSGSNTPNTDELHIRAGEFIASEMEAMMNQDALIRAAVNDLKERAKDRKSILVFTAGLDHASKVATALEQLGPTGTVFGETEYAERAKTIDRFKNGALRFLVNVNVLTEGFDHPGIDCIVLMRATMSPGLYYQMVGRGLRLSRDKTDCLVLDYGRNVIRHGPIDRIKTDRKYGTGTGETEPPGKMCPGCSALIFSGYTVCPHCGFEFPRFVDHEARASEAAIMSDDSTTIEVYTVQGIGYYLHRKKDADADAPRTLRVEYKIGYAKWVSEWVCFEHTGYPRKKAERWWRERSNEICPLSSESAVWAGKDGALKEPTQISVAKSPGERFDRIIGYSFDEQENLEEEPKIDFEDDYAKYGEIPF